MPTYSVNITTTSFVLTAIKSQVFNFPKYLVPEITTVKILK